MTPLPRAHVGTSGYSYAAWKGSFYPKDLPASKMLEFYATRFDTVEINASFYRMPDAATLAGWAAKAPPEFRFVLKASRQITHIKRLKDADEAVRRFFHPAGELGDRLGPVLFQLPPNLKKDAPRLAEFLRILPAGIRPAFEFRHESWFDEAVYGTLRDAGAALCLAEDEDLATPPVATASWGYLRLRRLDYDDAALARWAETLKAQSWSEAYVFFKHEDEAKGPMFAERFVKLLG